MENLMINLESRIPLPNQDDLDNFAQEFKNKIILENELKNKKNFTEIILENNKQTSFYYQGEEYILLIIAYSNSNFVILSKNKKIGNIYSADLEDSEFPDDEESIDLPPQYETKCILGNRLDLLNNFLSNFIAANIFFIFNKIKKIEKFKLFGLNDLTNKDITSDGCSKNENSFLLKTIKNYSNLMISTDLKIESLCPQELISKGENRIFDEYELGDLIKEFLDILKKEIYNLLN